MIVVMRIGIFILCLWSFSVTASAYEAIVIDPVSSSDYVTIENVTQERTYYGELDNYPHTFQFEVTDPVIFTAQLKLPKNENTNRSVIIVRKEKRGVSEVTRLRPAEANWSEEYSFGLAVTQLQGEVYSQELGSGSYLLEVSTADNIGPYALVVGTEKPWRLFGYFKTLSEISTTHKALGYWKLRILLSPYVFVPILLSLGWYLFKRKRNIQHA